MTRPVTVRDAGPVLVPCTATALERPPRTSKPVEQAAAAVQVILAALRVATPDEREEIGGVLRPLADSPWCTGGDDD